ncbi:DUF3795 domain-containing protein [Candidatus Bathyarchaeota archaeon]|nr:DUF3795 domain-containing protein [Candidatus Bathyarchaeota archaeon]
MEYNNKLGRCGIYCGQCRAFSSEIAELATQLKKYVVRDFTWLKENEDSFDYDNFLKGLGWFMDSICPGCRGSEETWCDVKKCSKILDDLVYNCLLCEEFSECTFTGIKETGILTSLSILSL